MPRHTASHEYDRRKREDELQASFTAPFQAPVPRPQGPYGNSHAQQPGPNGHQGFSNPMAYGAPPMGHQPQGRFPGPQGQYPAPQQGQQRPPYPNNQPRMQQYPPGNGPPGMNGSGGAAPGRAMKMDSLVGTGRPRIIRGAIPQNPPPPK